MSEASSLNDENSIKPMPMGVSSPPKIIDESQAYKKKNSFLK